MSLVYYKNMEKLLETNLLLEIEQDLVKNTDLLELARTYCEFHGDKSDEISTLYSVLGQVVDMQNSLVKKIDKLLTE